jgi:thioredoxin reductase/polyferredoxin
MSTFLFEPLRSYTHWLHTRWPAGKPETLPVVSDDGSTNVSGLYVVGDLSGIPLLKLSVNAGVRVTRQIDEELKEKGKDETLDLAIVGGGTAGFAAAREAERLGLSYLVFEASEPFSTIVNFPKEKPIYKYPRDMALEGDLEFHDKSDIKEGLLEDLREQTLEQGLRWVRGRASHVEKKGGGFEVVLGDGAEPVEGVDLGDASWVQGRERVKAQRVIVAIGRSGNYRKLGIPGEEKDHKVFNRLHDPKDYCGQNVVVVGGGDSAMETAIALALCGSKVTLSYRKPEFNRPKPENREKLIALSENPTAEGGIEQPSDARQASAVFDDMDRGDSAPGSIRLLMSSNLTEIRDDAVEIKKQDGQVETIENDTVFAMIGREPPLGFFRRSGVKILGERDFTWWWTLIAFFLLCFWVYHWKGDYALFAVDGWELPSWLQLDAAALGHWLGDTLGGWATSMTNPLGVFVDSLKSRPTYYTMLYSGLVVVFGIRRIRRRRTPYVKVQTLTLMAIQVIPLFLLPVILLPWFHALGWFDGGFGAWIERTFFPGESWWRAYGLILAWPLMAWNWWTAEPIWGWLILGFLQTFVAIPAMIYFWGKGSYCGWICSCGAMAETLGDTHRHKMPHGPFWNRLNMVGQAILLFAVLLMVVKILAWNEVGWAKSFFDGAARQVAFVNYAWMVDLFFAGAIGYGLYFWFSGRVWCRFACPLAALMHIYARFSRFGILAEKKKCISCNVCTSVCHQGIDIMSFANKGEPMIDPECVRCSACVQMCPTGVLSFGQINRDGDVIARDPAWLAASPVRMAELTVNGKKT